MTRCLLCDRQLDGWNASEVCAECVLLVANLLRARIEERWRPAASSSMPDVIVSDRGRIARLLNVDRSHRYPRVGIAGRKFYVHSLVAAAWHGPRPRGALVLHGDDDPANPSAANLRYGDHAANAADRRRNHRPRKLRERKS